MLFWSCERQSSLDPVSKSACFFVLFCFSGFKFAYAIIPAYLYVQVFDYVLKAYQHVTSSLYSGLSIHAAFQEAFLGFIKKVHEDDLYLFSFIHISLFFFPGTPWTQWHKATSPWPGGLILSARYTSVTPDTVCYSRLHTSNNNQIPLLLKHCKTPSHWISILWKTSSQPDKTVQCL